jgi:hypothetical protein
MLFGCLIGFPPVLSVKDSVFGRYYLDLGFINVGKGEIGRKGGSRVARGPSRHSTFCFPGRDFHCSLL